jgi:phage-related protein (TIGR01555 family)
VNIDGLYNLVTGLGVRARDKSTAASWEFESLTQQQCDAIYASSGLAARIVDLVPYHTFRRGFELKTTAAPEFADRVMDRWHVLRAADRIADAMRWARLYGGGAVVVAVDDGLDPREPMRIERVRGIRGLRAVSRWELQPRVVVDDPYGSDIGEPELYDLNPLESSGPFGIALRSAAGPVAVHRSRVLRFDGHPLPPSVRRVRQGWGGSMLERARKAINNWRTVLDGLAVVGADFAPLTIHVKNLKALLAGNGERDVLAWFDLQARMRSIINAILLDNDEKAERQTVTLAGVEHLVNSMHLDVATETGLPMTWIVGGQGTGLGQTHDADTRRGYDMIAAEQESGQVRSACETVLGLIMREPSGATGGKELEDWQIEWRPLWQPTEIELADIQLKTAQRDDIYMNWGVLQPVEVRRSRYGGRRWSAETSIDATLDPAALPASDPAAPASSDPSGAPPPKE